MKMLHEATKRERLPEKLTECEFFLGLMDRHKECGRPYREFTFYFSAFLCAYSSLWNRSFGVVRHGRGNEAAGTFDDRLGTQREVNWIKRLRDYEVHGDGVTIWEEKPRGIEWRHAVLFPPVLVERCRAGLDGMKRVLNDEFPGLFV